MYRRLSSELKTISENPRKSGPVEKYLSRRGFLECAAACAASIVIPGLPADAKTSTSKPNFVLIVADDLGYGDIRCFGNHVNRTPNLDQLAAEGMRFTDFHSNGPMCSPTRAALLTGRYQQRMGIESALGKNGKGLPRGEITIAERLREDGYATAIFGKWHLGDRLEDNPVHQGFDEFRGHTYGDSDYASHIDRHGDPDWWHNQELVNERGYNTSLLTDHAIRFIKQNKNRPFFLYVPHSAIHFPWMTPEDSGHREPGKDYTRWRADTPLADSKLGPHRNVGPAVKRMIEELDKSIGRIIAELKRHGLDTKTFVFFTSDNGGYLHYSSLHRGEISSNGKLRGQKGDVFEGGHRVPAIAWWSGKIKPGLMTHETAMTMDLMPTYLDLAGLETPAAGSSQALDGTSLAQLLFKAQPLPERTVFWCIRRRRAARSGPWKFIWLERESPMLFNLDNDIAETNDLAARRPEVVRKLKDTYEKWEKVVNRQKNTDRSDQQ
jgi:arylsulfatase A-like enzyme